MDNKIKTKYGTAIVNNNGYYQITSMKKKVRDRRLKWLKYGDLDV